MSLVISTFVGLLLLGVPVAFGVGIGGFVGLWSVSPAAWRLTVQTMLHQLNSFVLLAVPLFILAGTLMETGGIARRLVALAAVLVRPIRGGLGMAVVVAEYIFSGISGSTIADVSAVAAATIPSLVQAGYRPELAVAIVSSASAMGILVPPCILMIVMGSIANLSVAALFTAGFVPAMVMAAVLMLYLYRRADSVGDMVEAASVQLGLRQAVREALIPLGMPVIIFGGILGGVVTPTEAAVVAVLYAAVAGLFVYKEIGWRDLPGIIVKCCTITGSVGFLLAAAGVVSWYLTIQQMPAVLLRWMTVIPASRMLFLFTTAALFILFGAVIEGLPAIVILLPSLLPVATQLGIHPIHYSIVIIAAVGIGLFLPPIGVGICLAAGIAGVTMDRATRGMLPFVMVLVMGLVIVILVPWLTLVLPRLFKLL